MSIAEITVDDPSSPEPRVRPLHPEIEAQHDTSAMGMVVFLGSWAVMFAAFFFAFGFYRVSATSWPPAAMEHVPFWLPLLSTGVLVASSVALERGRRLLERGNPVRFRAYLWQSTALAIAFLGLQILLWTTVWSSGVTVSSGQFAGHFYLLTVFHGLHVLVGLVLLGRLIPMAYGPPTPRLAVNTKVTTLFWHFVGVAWVLIFLLLFVL